jgi:hypothetical protein
VIARPRRRGAALTRLASLLGSFHHRMEFSVSQNTGRRGIGARKQQFRQSSFCHSDRHRDSRNMFDLESSVKQTIIEL